MAVTAKDEVTKATKRMDELHIPYELIHYAIDTGDLSGEHAADDMELPYDVVYKTLVLRGNNTGVIEACIPSGCELDIEALARVSGNDKVAMVNQKELFLLTGYVMGGCSPIKSGKLYPVYIHSDALNHEKFAVNAGARGQMFYMPAQEFAKAAKAQFADIAKKKR
ncbi:MAG: Cys-tRNA(Pro) deacylase [Synergistaceae bacterium]|nr:Cys-tRNA(Pro) deacylase [Synergistaceae bacterium]